MTIKPEEKLYYSIVEVAQQVGLKEYVLRYWESEFPQLKPKRYARKRLYTQNDIDVVVKIKHLLHEKGMTIKGAKQQFKEHTILTDPVDRVKAILEHLESLRAFLSNFSN